MSSDCSICCESYNKSSRKPVKCLHCSNVCCRACHQTYLFSRDVIDCMFCQKPQTYEHIKNSHYDTFIKSTGSWKGKGYREHLENVYYKNEMAMFPETQKIIERKKKKEKILKKIKINNEKKTEILKDIKLFQKERRDNCSCKKGPTTCICVSEKNRLKWLEERDYKYALIENLEVANDELCRKYGENDSNEKKVSQIQKCMASNCDGFLDSNWICNKCNKKTCSRCREVKEDNHVCNEDTVKTIQLAIRTSKPCPKCSERIHRIYGCDQVYCPLCKIVFSYSTGVQQLGGVVHQPDAVEELRKTGRLYRDVRDIPCGGVEHIRLKINNKNDKTFMLKIYPNMFSIIHAILRWCIDYENLQITQVARDENLLNINSLEREVYLSGQMSIEKFKKIIYKNYRDFEKRKEERIIKSGFYTCLTDIIRSLENMNDYQKIHETMVQMFILCENYNYEFERVNKLYGNSIDTKLTIFMDVIVSRHKNVKYPRLYFGVQQFGIIKTYHNKHNLNFNSLLNRFPK